MNQLSTLGLQIFELVLSWQITCRLRRPRYIGSILLKNAVGLPKTVSGIVATPAPVLIGTGPPSPYNSPLLILMNIKYLGYARYSTAQLIYSVNKDKDNRLLSNDSDTIFNKIKSMKLKNQERQKFKTDYGVWFVKHDKNDISYAVCAKEDYPERHAYGLIDKIQKNISEITHVEYQSEINIKGYSKNTAVQLVEDYNDLRKIDKVHQALHGVRELQNDLGEGIKKLINNKESLQDLDDRARKMKDFAGEFQKNSSDLQRLMYWRSMKIKILVGLVVIGIVGFVIFIIIQKVRGR